MTVILLLLFLIFCREAQAVIKIRHLLLLVLTLLLAGCKFAILDPKGVIAASEKHLFIVAMLLMLTVVIPVIFLSLYIPWKYRASNKSATYKPKWAHSNLLEAIMWSIPCIIIGILAVITWVSTHQLDPYKPLASKKKPVIIEAIALNWKWLFIYPDFHVASVNFIQIPVDRPVRFLITSDAPMNSLEIPQLAGQIYAMTGMQTKLNIMATHKGTYRGLSTNFSGDGFAGMHFKVKVSSENEFNQWIQEVKHAHEQLTMARYNALTKNSSNNPVEYFSTSKPGIFRMAIMKYMGGAIHGMGYDNAHLSLQKMPQHLTQKSSEHKS